MNEDQRTPLCANQNEEPERWLLHLRMRTGSRSAWRQLVADLRGRHGSKVDPLLTGDFADAAASADGLIIFGIRPHRLPLVDEALRPYHAVDVTATIIVEGVGEREHVDYLAGRRTSEWTVHESALSETVRRAGDVPYPQTRGQLLDWYQRLYLMLQRQTDVAPLRLTSDGNGECTIGIVCDSAADVADVVGRLRAVADALERRTPTGSYESQRDLSLDVVVPEPPEGGD